jgi:hypothetical protein
MSFRCFVVTRSVIIGFVIELGKFVLFYSNHYCTVQNIKCTNLLEPVPGGN